MSGSKRIAQSVRRDLVTVASAGVGTFALAGIGARPATAAAVVPDSWDLEADIVVIGSGAMGLPAAIVAKEAGASVIVVEAENHIGGHAIVSGGTVVLGGGTSAQKKFGITDSPDLLFRDLTDWTVVEAQRRGGLPIQRPRDRSRLCRQRRADLRMADRRTASFSSLLRRIRLTGVVRQFGAALDARRSMDWPKVQTGKPLAPEYQFRHRHRRRPHASPAGRGREGRREDFASNTG